MPLTATQLMQPTENGAANRVQGHLKPKTQADAVARLLSEDRMMRPRDVSAEAEKRWRMDLSNVSALIKSWFRSNGLEPPIRNVKGEIISGEREASDVEPVKKKVTIKDAIDRLLDKDHDLRPKEIADKAKALYDVDVNPKNVTNYVKRWFAKKGMPFPRSKGPRPTTTKKTASAEAKGDDVATMVLKFKDAVALVGGFEPARRLIDALEVISR